MEYFYESRYLYSSLSEPGQPKELRHVCLMSRNCIYALESCPLSHLFLFFLFFLSFYFLYPAPSFAFLRLDSFLEAD